jgi:predicted ATPase/DNA-binding CsgD family transcriptional regulator
VERWNDAELTFGRDRAHLEARSLLEEHGWLTVVGPGGVGKTRFAMGLIRPMPSNVIVDASALGTAAQLTAALAVQLEGIGDVDDAQLEILLDNLEQIEGAAEVMAQLRLEHPGWRIVATSRTPLGLVLEVLYPLGGLDTTPHGPAVELFVARTGHRRPGWQPGPDERPLVSALCEALDGLPLAIELVAARAHTIPLRTMVKRFADSKLLPTYDATRIARHSGLETVVGWSLELLEPREREALEALATLDGSFSLSFAARLLDRIGIDARSITALARSNLIALENAGTYRLLSTVRAVVLSRPGRLHLGEEVLCMAVAAHVHALYEGCTTGSTEDRLRLVREFEVDWPHTATVLGSRGLDVEYAFKVACPLAEIVYKKAHMRVLIAYFDRLLDNATLTSERRLKLLWLQGDLMSLVRDPRVEAVCRVGVELATVLGDPSPHFAFLDNLGNAALVRREYDVAAGHFQEALALAETRGNARMLRVSLSNLAHLYRRQERFAEARALIDRALGYMSDDEIIGRAFIYAESALVAFHTGNHIVAIAELRRSLDLAWEHDIEQNVHFALDTVLGLAIRMRCREIVAELYPARLRLEADHGRDYKIDAGLRADALEILGGVEPDAFPDVTAEDLEQGLRRALDVLETEVHVLDDLTPRERTLAQLIDEGHSNSSISRLLGISERTVRNQLSELYTKLGVGSRAEARAALIARYT